MATFNENGASEFIEDSLCRIAKAHTAGNGGFCEQFRFGNVWSDEIGERQQLSLEHSNGIGPEKPRSAGRHHHRIDYLGNARSASESICNYVDNRRAKEHAGLERAN